MRQTFPTGFFLKHFGIFQNNCSKEHLRAAASQRVTSNFLQRATSTMSNEQILKRVTNNELISTSNEQRVKSYALHSRLKEIYTVYMTFVKLSVRLSR